MIPESYDLQVLALPVLSLAQQEPHPVRHARRVKPWLALDRFEVNTLAVRVLAELTESGEDPPPNGVIRGRDLANEPGRRSKAQNLAFEIGQKGLGILEDRRVAFRFPLRLNGHEIPTAVTVGAKHGFDGT